MGIIKRIALLVFGFLSILLGFLSIIVSIVLMTANFSDIDHPGGWIYMMVFKLIFSEVFFAFGVAASLVGLRCAFGPREWLIKTIDFTWKRAISFALIWGYFMMAFMVLLWLVRLFLSFL